MQLVLARSDLNQQPAQHVFEKDDLAFMEILSPSLEGKTDAQKNLNTPKTLKWAAWIIGRLGAWKGYNSERPPGPITMKNGLEKFTGISLGWKLAKDVCIR